MLKLLTGTLFFCSLILCGCAEDVTTNLAANAVPSAAGDDVSLPLDPLSSLSVDDDSGPQSTDALESASPSQQSSDDEGVSGDNEEEGEQSTDLVDESAAAAGEETEEAAPSTPEEYVAAINDKLQPTGMDIPGAIALTEEAYAKFPDDPVILQGLIGLLYQSLRIESDQSIVNQRRMRLGQLAREWIERNQESVENLGNMPVLLLEEAKAYLADEDAEKAFASVQQARNLGFTQTMILFYDPAFADLIADEKASIEIKKWLAEEVAAQVAQTESFPFDFHLSSFAGEEVGLSDFKGKVLIVDFWGTWCPPCRKEIPHFVELVDRRADDLAVVGINIEDPSGADVDFEAAKARFDEFVQTQPINYPCLAGNRETVEQVPDFEGYPTTLFLDETGRVRLKLTGYHPLEMLEAAVDHLLKDQAPTG